MNRTLLYLSLAITTVALFGCSSAVGQMQPQRAAVAPSASYVEAEKALAPAQEDYLAEAPEAGFADESALPTTSSVQQDRVVIYTGNLSLVVQDTREAVTAITDLAAEQGGYVSGSYTYLDDDVMRGSITIRILAENYRDTMEKLRELAVRVESENINTQDVTEEFTDLEARKTNLEHTEEALQKLLDERQKVGRTQDILEVYRELTNSRGQIEQIEGRLRYLSNQSALSTITVELIPHILYQPVSVGGWEPRGVAKSALQSLVAALQGLTSVLIWAVIFILPLLVIILIPIAIIVLVIRSVVRRRRAAKS
ncbi:MAG: DUF4349 domain-containing protein [Ardenticatenia bacterium]|nr:DUF4349 domain-containing protein [Ardenticatenia bacterium]